MKEDNEIKEHLAREQRRAILRTTQEDGSKVVIGAFVRATPGDVDVYHKMKLKDLISEYASLYFVVNIYGQSSVSDAQYMHLIEREIYEFRDKEAQIEFENTINEIDEVYKRQAEESHKMSFKDLVDTYIRLENNKDGIRYGDGVSTFSIEQEIYEFRSREEQIEFEKIRDRRGN